MDHPIPFCGFKQHLCRFWPIKSHSGKMLLVLELAGVVVMAVFHYYSLFHQPSGDSTNNIAQSSLSMECSEYLLYDFQMRFRISIGDFV